VNHARAADLLEQVCTNRQAPAYRPNALIAMLAADPYWSQTNDVLSDLAYNYPDTLEWLEFCAAGLNSNRHIKALIETLLERRFPTSAEEAKHPGSIARFVDEFWSTYRTHPRFMPKQRRSME
jgi:hypothetical protein